MIDTHCHLDVEAFDEDRDEVIARAGALCLERTLDLRAPSSPTRTPRSPLAAIYQAGARAGVRPIQAKPSSARVWMLNRSSR